MIGLQRNAEQERFVDYLDYFGLSADPFESNTVPYFQSEQRRRTLSELLHLCQFSTSVLAVVGEAGVGKSCLKQALLDHLDQDDIICDVEAPVLSAADQILKRIVQQLSIPVVSDQQRTDIGGRTQALISSISDFAAAPATQDCLKVLLVENAHNLDDQTLLSLLKLSPAKGPAAKEQSHRQFHVVLFGEPQLSQRLQNLESEWIVVKQFLLAPLAREELKSYLRFRLSAVGFDGIFPFKEEDIQFLWDISHGLPTALHDAAREILIELATPPPESKSLGLPVGHMALIIALVAVLLIAVFYRSEVDTEPEQVATVDAATTDTETGAGAMTRPNSGGAMTELEQSAAETDDVDVTEQLIAAEGSDTDSEPAAVAANEFVAQNTASAAPTPDSIKPATVDRPAPPASPSARLESTVANGTGEAAADPPLTADEKRLLALAPEGFTLQVLASGSKAAVDAYLSRQPNRRDLAVFSTLRDGKVTYIVVAGNFKTSDAARQAVPQLPKEQQQAGPWPRTLQSVQADIRAVRDP